MKRWQPVNFYLANHINPLEWGFEERERSTDSYWYLSLPNQNSAIYIEKTTRKIHCNGVSSKLLATLFRIAAKNGIEIEDPENGEKRVRMSLTTEEYEAVQAMRNHPPRGEKVGENAEPSGSN